MNHRTRGALVAGIAWALAAAGGSTAPAADWPAWRGPTGDGVSPEEDLPLRWSETEGIRWKAPLPEPGSSTPIVWGDRVFLTQAVERGRRRTLMCLDRRTGEVLWRAGVDWTEEETTHPSNPFCSSSPVTDGERVVAFFGSAGLHAYDLQGKELWSRSLGKIEHMGGWASSPVLHGDLCILNFGPGPGAALVAVEKRTGVPLWRVETGGAKAEASPDAAAASGPRGRSGPGRMLGWALFAASDLDRDERISEEELRAMASRWLEAADPKRSGAVDGLPLAEGLLRLAGPRREAPRTDGAVRPEPREMAKHLAPVVLGAVDTSGDGRASARELEEALARWAEDWDVDADGIVVPNELRAGVSRVFSPGQEGRGPGGPDGGSWGTPIVATVDDRPELVAALPGRLLGLDLASGKEIWSVDGLGHQVRGSPVWGGGLVAIHGGGLTASAMAVRPGREVAGGGARRLWHLPHPKNRTGSSVIHRGRLYSVTDGGIAECLDLATGQTLWEGRLQGSGKRSTVWSSPVLVNDRIYVTNQSGETFVLRAGPRLDVIRLNSIGDETVTASLAVSRGQLFIRTFRGLWCIGAEGR